MSAFVLEQCYISSDDSNATTNQYTIFYLYGALVLLCLFFYVIGVIRDKILTRRKIKRDIQEREIRVKKTLVQHQKNDLLLSIDRPQAISLSHKYRYPFFENFYHRDKKISTWSHCLKVMPKALISRWVLPSMFLLKDDFLFSFRKRGFFLSTSLSIFFLLTLFELAFGENCSLLIIGNVFSESDPSDSLWINRLSYLALNTAIVALCDLLLFYLLENSFFGTKHTILVENKNTAIKLTSWTYLSLPTKKYSVVEKKSFKHYLCCMQSFYEKKKSFARNRFPCQQKIGIWFYSMAKNIFQIPLGFFGSTLKFLIVTFFVALHLTSLYICFFYFFSSNTIHDISIYQTLFLLLLASFFLWHLVIVPIFLMLYYTVIRFLLLSIASAFSIGNNANIASNSNKNWTTSSQFVVEDNYRLEAVKRIQRFVRKNNERVLIAATEALSATYIQAHVRTWREKLHMRAKKRSIICLSALELSGIHYPLQSEQQNIKIIVQPLPLLTSSHRTQNDVLASFALGKKKLDEKIIGTPHSNQDERLQESKSYYGVKESLRLDEKFTIDGNGVTKLRIEVLSEQLSQCEKIGGCDIDIIEEREYYEREVKKGGRARKGYHGRVLEIPVHEVFPMVLHLNISLQNPMVEFQKKFFQQKTLFNQKQTPLLPNQVADLSLRKSIMKKE